MYVSALSSYDQLLVEDSKTNRLHEELNLFEDLLMSEWFDDPVPFILFLNKKDIFREKIKKTPLTVCFPEYEGPPHDYRSCCLFIKEQFLRRSRNPDRRIYTHFTNATDTDSFRVVFTSVQDIILRQHLAEAGLLGPGDDQGQSEDFGVSLEFGDEELP